MRKLITSAGAALLLLAGCSGQSADPATVTVTATRAATPATVTADPVTITATSAITDTTEVTVTITTTTTEPRPSATTSMTTASAVTASDIISFSMSCSSGSNEPKQYRTYRDALKAKPRTDYCDADPESGGAKSGTVMSTTEKEALRIAYGKDADLFGLSTLFGLCGEANSDYADSILTIAQAKEALGMLTLCPHHPQAKQIKTNADAVTKRAQMLADGKYVNSGHHLVGKDIQPGTWQSVGDKVTDCYWEVSDSSGNIIDNNYISLAPQFTVHIPSSAAGFTNQGCAFQWIGN